MSHVSELQHLLFHLQVIESIVHPFPAGKAIMNLTTTSAHEGRSDIGATSQRDQDACDQALAPEEHMDNVGRNGPRLLVLLRDSCLELEQGVSWHEWRGIGNGLWVG